MDVERADQAGETRMKRTEAAGVRQGSARGQEQTIIDSLKDPRSENMTKKLVLVTGAGGFIGHHLTKYLMRRGYQVRGVDIKAPEYEASPADEFLQLDLRLESACQTATAGAEEVYHLAADMGGIGYITSQHAGITLNNTLINVHMLKAAHENGVSRFLFSSSACIYPQHLQSKPDIVPLREEDAFPADPEEGYGLEKLYMEKLCQYFSEDWGFPTRVVRFHNVYGPLGTYDGGREKAPAAISRKVAAAADGGTIDIWGDGQQTRSFLYIDECVEGTLRLMRSDFSGPVNIGSDEMVSINGLAEMIMGIAEKPLGINNIPGPTGVRGRNSDNRLIREKLGWAPQRSLAEGLAPTYRWIERQLLRNAA